MYHQPKKRGNNYNHDLINCNGSSLKLICFIKFSLKESIVLESCSFKLQNIFQRSQRRKYL